MVKGYRVAGNKLVMLIACAVTCTIFILNSCSPSEADKAAARVEEGKALSQKFCVSCHRYPEPQLLDKKTWEKGVLPVMAKQLGLQQEMGQLYADKRSLLSVDNYQKIVEFYKSIAPEKLTLPKHHAVQDYAVFSLKRPVKVDTTALAMVTMIKFNPFDKLVYTGDMSNNLLSWNAGLNQKLVKKTPSAVTAANFYQTVGGQNMGIFTCIGVLPPNDQLEGLMVDIDLKAHKPYAKPITDSLPRPVQTAAGDFNRDGLTDYIVCGYGNTRGGLYLVQQQANGNYKKQVIRAVPGAIQVEVGDFNNDGWPDVMCLFAQANEGVWMFLNNKKGGFTTRNMLRFPPVYGSNSFQLVDMNNDGQKDIIYTCGDNNDYSSILKPYHGMYVFTNKGNWNFKQSYFYHINGASKAMAADFDGDGDMDIATIAFFADFKYHPTEGFTYLEQTGKSKFKAHEVPINQYGRWIAMEVADIDSDGDQDIVLGNFSVYSNQLINQKDYKPDWDTHSPIILLENRTVKK